MGVVGLVFAAGGAGAAWFVAQRHAPAEESHAKREPASKPIFLPLDPFTVNLQDARGERFAQIGMTLQLIDGAAEHDMKERLPTVRNDILLLLATKKIDDLLSAEGKTKLAQEVRGRAARTLGFEEEEEAPKAKPGAKPRPAPVNPVQDVLFSQFIVQ